MTGLSKKSLQTWQRREDSKGVSSVRGVLSQSVESGTSNSCCILDGGGETMLVAVKTSDGKEQNCLLLELL